MNYLIVQSLLTPGIIVLMGIVILTALLFFYYMFKKENDFEKKEEAVVQDYTHIVQEAQLKAKEIIDQASTEAATIIATAQTTRITIDKKEEDTFEKIAKEQEQLLQTNSAQYFHDYQASLDEVKNHYTTQLNEMVNQIRETTEKEILDLKSSLKTQMVGSNEGVAKKIQDDFAKTQIEISEYKRHQIEKMQASIDQILIKVCEEVLGKTIPMHDHEELILNALEKAKTEGMFTV